MYFNKAGASNTDSALDIAFQEAKKRKIKNMVIATTRGATAAKAAERAGKSGINLVVVTHNTGFNKLGEQQLEEGYLKILREKKVRIITGTLPARSLGRSVREKLGFNPLDMITEAWKVFGEGTKVCIEITASACDAGAIPAEDVISVAGSWEGADTVLLLSAMPSNRMLDIKVREILAKPADWRY